MQKHLPSTYSKAPLPPIRAEPVRRSRLVLVGEAGNYCTGQFPRSSLPPYLVKQKEPIVDIDRLPYLYKIPWPRLHESTVGFALKLLGATGS